MLQRQPYHIQIQDHLEKILDLLSDMLWPALRDKFVQLFQPTHQFSLKLLLEHDHQKVCASPGLPPWRSSPILAMEAGRSERRRRIVGKHPQRRQCSQHPSSGRGHCAHRTEALSFHGHWDGESVGAAQSCGKGCMRFLVWGATWFRPFFFEWHGKFPWLRHDLFICLLGKTTIQR